MVQEEEGSFCAKRRAKEGALPASKVRAGLAPSRPGESEARPGDSPGTARAPPPAPPA